MNNHRSIVLLAAGSGSRLKPLTDDLPKCLLPIGDKVVLDWILDALLSDPEREIVIVSGYAGEKIEAHLAQNYAESNIRTVRNDRYLEDVNILSVDIGVDSLRNPEAGYSIVETDLLLDSAAWKRILNAEDRGSYWVTRGCYGPELTGGIVNAGVDGASIDGIAYVPEYDPAYAGWNKMVGILSVGPDEVVADRHWRKQAVKESCAQYYMVPWINHADELPCTAVDLGSAYAASFNTADDYHQASDAFVKHIQQ